MAKNTVQHTWEEWYEFPLEEVDGHIVEVNMYDKDKMSSDEFLGYAAIDIKTFSQVVHLFNRGTGPQPVLSGKLTQATPGRLGSQQAVPTLPVSQPIHTRYILAIMLYIPPYLLCRLVEATLEPVAGRKTKYTKITGKIGVELAWQPLVPRPGRDTARLFPGSTAAVLSVFIYSANNLAKVGVSINRAA